MAEEATGGLRKIAIEKNGEKPAGEPKGYCGPCGLPDAECQCGSYRESGQEDSGRKG